MTPHLTRGHRPGLLASLGLAALATSLLVPLVTRTDVGVLPAPRPAVQLSGLPAGNEVSLPDTAGSDLAGLVEEQRRKGLECTLTRASLPACTHGGDPELHRLPSLVTAEGGPSGSTTGSGIGCYGNGRDGHRVQAVYARAEGSADRYSTVLPDLRRYAAGTDAAFDRAARTTNGRRHVRFATTPSCELDVIRTLLPASAFRSMGSLVDALQVKGFQQSSRSYLVWADVSVLCGIATMYVDDSPGLDNINNGSMPSYARVDRPCWGKAEVHELVHALGGVQPSAPNSTGGYHCSDGADVMCYDDKTARSTQRSVCPASSTQVLDCRHDDYFSTAAPRGSYLQTRWNVARSSFLTASWDAPAPSPSASPGPMDNGATPADTGPAPAPSPHASPTASSSPSPSPTTSPSPSAGGGLGLPPLPPLPPLPTVSVPPLLSQVGVVAGLLVTSPRRGA